MARLVTCDNFNSLVYSFFSNLSVDDRNMINSALQVVTKSGLADDLLKFFNTISTSNKEVINTSLDTVTKDNFRDVLLNYFSSISAQDKLDLLKALGAATRKELCEFVNADIYTATALVNAEYAEEYCDANNPPATGEISEACYILARRAGYAFHPEDLRDPDANVKFAFCNGQLQMFLYPDATPEHNIAITDCDGNIYGYALNKPFIIKHKFNCE